tara:strand:- start:1346 stop:1675 length:330 start_codon:yes stop_codon:yes gene_type:complete
MEIAKDEKIERISKEDLEGYKNSGQESLEQDQNSFQRKKFKVDLPDGRIVSTLEMDDEQYKISSQMLLLQNQIDHLGNQIAEFEMKKDHFALKQKQLMDLIPIDGKTTN